MEMDVLATREGVHCKLSERKTPDVVRYGSGTVLLPVPVFPRPKRAVDKHDLRLSATLIQPQSGQKPNQSYSININGGG